VNDYDDDIESIENSLKHALEVLDNAKDYLRRGSALKASYEVFEAGTIARSAEAYTQGLYRALEREAKQ
jgi:DNA-binding phage protein